MKKIILYTLLIIMTINTKAGDTTKILVHDNVDMTWYGNYDKLGIFPDGSETYRKIYLHYTMGCATNGCSDWDYTTSIEVLHKTGEIDSNLQVSPLFTVNGINQDTIYFSLNPVMINTWNTNTNSLEIIASDSILVVQYNDVNNPEIPTDTLIYYESNINIYIFDSSGNIIDTIYNNADSSLILTFHNWYSYYDVKESFELAKVITPYGGGLNNNWEFTHIFDVTDFASVLKDSVEIRAHYSGWSSGFSATLNFEFIEGIPPRNVTSLKNIYKGGCSYNNSSSFEQNCLPPKMFWVDANSHGGMVKMTTTGHGFDNNIYAAEFKPIDYYLKIDGNLTHTQFNWDPNCGENPIYPQGGTWILDRANWCPGTRAQTFNHEITNYITTSDSVEINIDFQSYSWTGTQTPSYNIACQLFLFDEANFINDVEIIDIIKPSLKDEYSRFNPICGNPLIKIRNYGNDELTSVRIEYGVTGGVTHTYIWNGFLPFMEETEVELPLLENWYGTKDIFEVTLSNPNGQNDEYNDNNIMKTAFEHVPQYENRFAVWTKTNNGVISTWSNESETSWKFFTDDGNLHYVPSIFYANDQYRDTINFESGCYTFILEDTDEDGLDYWNNSDGAGYIKFRNVPGSWFPNFSINPDFGTNIIHNFRVGNILSSSNISDEVDIFPNPTSNNISLSSKKLKGSTIKIMNILGEVVYLETANSNSKTISLLDFNNGIYSISIKGNTINFSQKIVKN